MSGDELLGGRTEAVSPGRLGDRSGPSLGQRGIELLRAAMGLAGALRAAQEPSSSFRGTVTFVQHPRDAEVLQMAHAAREDGPRFPSVGQLLVGHGQTRGREAYREARGARLLWPATVQASVCDRVDRRGV
jgi:hypothetical protein